MPEPLSIFEASALIHRGELTPSELLEQCLRRVEAYEYNVRAWVHLDRKRAREEAARFTEEIKAGLSRGPLHGIPIGIKDIIDVFDMPTGCGSKRWANSYARQDARCVTKLRNAGAVIMGKTVTTSYAFLDPPPTRNPWNHDRTPGGSSSGSAAAVACGMCLGALGSQTGGSLTRPASYCGIVSLKPTFGRVSVDGVLPLAPSLDHIGCMARSARDLPLLFDAIAGKATTPESGISQPSEMLDDPFTPINVLTGMFDLLLEPDCRTRFLDVLPTLFNRSFGASAGHGFQVPLAGFNDLPGFHKTIMAYEAAAYHGSRFERHPDDYPPRIRELIVEGLKTTEFAYHEANRNRITLANEFNDTLKGMFAVTSATVGPAPDATSTGSPALNSPWSYLGLPTVSVPFARDDAGMPLSIQLIGRRGSENRLLQTAIECEKRLNVRMDLPPMPSRTATSSGI